jgi:Icc-related predicted phosphoesterase
LPVDYLDYVIHTLDGTLFYVRGNHAEAFKLTDEGLHPATRGGINLHSRVVNFRSLLLAGVEGSGRYRPGPFQYSQLHMWWFVLSLVPALLTNRIRYGRYLDIFVTHAPPLGVNDQPDLPHRGIQAFLWLDQVFQPAYHFHGHIHLYRPDANTESRIGRTRVINTFGYRLTDLATITKG